jgi:hypothetical protein
MSDMDRVASIQGLVFAKMIAAHMIECPGVKKTDIVSLTPEYKLGWIEALANVMDALDIKVKEIELRTLNQTQNQQTQSQEQVSHEQSNPENQSAAPAAEPAATDQS